MNAGKELHFSVLSKQDGFRIDLFLQEMAPEYTRSFLQKRIETGDVLVNGKKISKSTKVKAGDSVFFHVPQPVDDTAKPEAIPLNIIYEDDDLLVVNKPKGIVVHPAPGNYNGTLVNGLLYHCQGNLSGINGVVRPGIVHRIDKDTSGLLVVAKNDRAHQLLAEQIQNHSFTREYEAVVYGHFRQEKGTVDAPIGRSKSDRKRMAVTDEHSRRAVTHYEVLKEFKTQFVQKVG